MKKTIGGKAIERVKREENVLEHEEADLALIYGEDLEISDELFRVCEKIVEKISITEPKPAIVLLKYLLAKKMEQLSLGMEYKTITDKFIEQEARRLQSILLSSKNIQEILIKLELFFGRNIDFNKKRIQTLLIGTLNHVKLQQAEDSLKRKWRDRKERFNGWRNFNDEKKIFLIGIEFGNAIMEMAETFNRGASVKDLGEKIMLALVGLKESEIKNREKVLDFILAIARNEMGETYGKILLETEKDQKIIH